MAMKFVTGRGWEFEPPSSCYLGGGASFGSGSSQNSGSGSSQSTGSTFPENFQNPSFGGMAPSTAQQLFGLGTGLPNSYGSDAAQMKNAFTFNNGQSTSNPDANPLVAPITDPQNKTLGQIGNFVDNLPNNLGGAFGLLNKEMDPNFASNLADSPQTKNAEEAAIAPIRQQFTSQTVPGLEGSFTQAGQRVGSSSGMGSSAFDNSFAAAQGNELTTEGAVTGQIANNAYQTGLNIQANAPGQMANLNSSELNDMISGLNAQALPQMVKQYGISAGTQLFQQQMNTIMQALGLQVQGEQPVLGYINNNQSSSNQQSHGSSSQSSFGGNAIL